MCGIAGILGKGVANARALLSQMLVEQAHRGPDGQGVWTSEDGVGVWLGHRRLSILDLSEAAAQPMVDTSGRYVLTFNGEIYNYVEVRAELRALGVSFRSDGDTEVLLEAYKQWGGDCLARLNGMFSFALYDGIRGKLFCARDRYGEKPFLFHCGKDFFAFASEYKSLLMCPSISMDTDEWRLLSAAYHPSTGLDAERQTVFRGVQQLLPSEAMWVDVRTLKVDIWRYWEIKSPDLRENATESEVFAEFRALLTDAVRLRLRSDVPVGSCLSGGLDSSAIVCIVRGLLGEQAPYNAFTGRFPGTPADEWSYAKLVIDQTHVISHVVEPTVDRFLDDLPQFLWHNELPVGSSSQFAQWCVFRLAKERGVTVLLDGQGADEALGGYEQYFAYYLEALRERGEWDRLKREQAQIQARYPLALTPKARGLRDRLPFRLRHFLSNRLGFGTSMLYGLRPEVAEKLSDETQLRRNAGFHALANALVQDSFGRFLTTLLRYGDRNSMAHSREVRLPFCDHRIAEFVFRLPPHLLMGEQQTKRMLRESMVGVLPEGVRTRWNKQGFRPPQDQWFGSPRLRGLVKETFQSKHFQQSPYWLAPWWQQALKRVEGGQLGLGWTLWHPLMIELWQEHFISPLRDRRAKMAKDTA